MPTVENEGQSLVSYAEQTRGARDAPTGVFEGFAYQVAFVTKHLSVEGKPGGNDTGTADDVLSLAPSLAAAASTRRAHWPKRVIRPRSCEFVSSDSAVR